MLHRIPGSVKKMGSGSGLSAIASGTVLGNFSGAPAAPTAVVARQPLSANRTYYVRTDGNDSNTGLVNSSGGAFLTIQKAINVCLTLDLNGFAVTIQVIAGTYTTGFSLSAPFIGGIVTLSGDTTTPSNVLINPTNANCFSVSNPGVVINVQGFKFVTTTSGSGIICSGGACVNITGKVDFGAMGGGASGFHLSVSGPSSINIGTPYTISGSAQGHWLVSDNATAEGTNLTITLTGTPAWTFGFVWCTRAGCADLYGCTFSGSATGPRYTADGASVIFVNGGGASYLPGNSAGSSSSGSQYY